MGNTISAVRIVATSLSGLGLQLVTYAFSLFTSGTGNLPQPAISIPSGTTLAIVALIGRFLPSLAAWNGMPTLVNLLAGWFILGLALLGLVGLFGKLFAAILVVVILILSFIIVSLVFGIHLPIPGITPTNSTQILQAFLE